MVTLDCQVSLLQGGLLCDTLTRLFHLCTWLYMMAIQHVTLLTAV